MELKYMTGKNATLVKTLQEKLKGIDGKDVGKGINYPVLKRKVVKLLTTVFQWKKLKKK